MSHRWDHPADYDSRPRRKADQPVDDFMGWIDHAPRRRLHQDVAAFIADLRANPWLAVTVFGFGMAAGMLATVGLAFVIAAVTA